MYPRDPPRRVREAWTLAPGAQEASVAKSTSRPSKVSGSSGVQPVPSRTLGISKSSPNNLR